MDVRHCERIYKEESKGLFSTQNFRKNDIIYTLEGLVLDNPTKFSIEIGENQHIIDEYGIFMNHSFEPTVKISGKNVIALSDLDKGIEICFNYNESETNMANPFLTDKGLVCGKNK